MKQIRVLIEQLKAANVAYYKENREIMSNYEYDKLYDQLVELEKTTGIIYPDSPTQSVGVDILDSLPKERHQKKMLSLDKTKEVSVLEDWLGNKDGILSWKLDGLTVVLTYDNGKLQKAVTRGNGSIGDIITSNAKQCSNVPLQIPYKGKLIVRGEAIITYSDFEKINSEIEDVDAKYKNPRNLASGSIRLLNSSESKNRNIKIVIFRLVQGGEESLMDKQFSWLSSMGFEVVEHYLVRKDTIEQSVKFFKRKINTNDIPTDGLVISYNDTGYGNSLGETSKFERHSFAFKWADEVAETTLREIEWSPSRTGLLNPVAIFDSVELEGTTVSRASVHNVSILKELQLGIGDKIQVYKANMIIPQIAENLTRSGNLEIPHSCPVCQKEARILKTNEVESLYCMNPECQAKKIKSFTLFVSRDAMNIDGLSEATLEKFILKGFIKDFGDVFEISRYKDQIVEMEGFGEKSYENLIASLENAKHTTLPRVLYSLGIANIGLANAKVICREFGYDVEKLIHASAEEINAIEGIGPVIAKAFTDYFSNEENLKKFHHLMSHLELEEVKKEENQTFAGKQFVITGSVVHFANRSQLKEFIEQRGGKVTGSVTSKTDYLINNDTASNSSKNKKAKELGIPILSEEDFLERAGEA